MARPSRIRRDDIDEAFHQLAEQAEADEHEAWCLKFYGPHNHTDTEPFRAARRGPWWPADEDFPGIEHAAAFEVGSRTPEPNHQTEDALRILDDLLPF